jgi:hypothetical protein
MIRGSKERNQVHGCVEHQKRTTEQSTLVMRTVRMRAKSVRVLNFLRYLLAKTVDLAPDTDCNGSRPPMYKYMED